MIKESLAKVGLFLLGAVPAGGSRFLLRKAPQKSSDNAAIRARVRSQPITLVINSHITTPETTNSETSEIKVAPKALSAFRRVYSPKKE